MPAEGPGLGEGAEDLPAEASLGGVLEGFRPRLERMLHLRLDPRLRARVDSADVLQETFAEVLGRIDEYRKKRPMPFFLWVRFLAGQKLLDFHRRHLNAAQRDARVELPIPAFPPASSASMAQALFDLGTPPERAAAREESLLRLQQALESMDEVDREVLVLRYFEQLSNEETALALTLSVSGAKKRHVRALARLRKTLAELGHDSSGLMDD